MATADFTIADVLAWARTKPADEAYDFCKPSRCAIAQFGIVTGRQHLVGAGRLAEVAPQLEPAMAAICLSESFGQLVRRLERVVEPSWAKRLWARLRGKTIGGTTFTYASAQISPTWLKADAYLTDIEQVVPA